MRSEIRGMLGLIIMSLRNLRQRKARTMLTILGITIGVAAMISVSITQETAQRTISETYNEAAGNADLIVTNATASIVDTEGFDADALVNVRETPGVELAAPLIQLTTSSSQELADWEDNLYLASINGTLLYGIDPASSSDIEHYNVVSGDDLNESTTDGALISESYADSLGIGIGDTLQLAIPGGMADFEIIGLTDSNGLVRLNRGKVVLTKLETVAAIAGRQDKLDQIDVMVGAGIDQEQLMQDLETILGPEYSVSLPQ